MESAGKATRKVRLMVKKFPPVKTMASLPGEVLNHVSLFLEVFEVLRLSVSCKETKRILDDLQAARFREWQLLACEKVCAADDGLEISKEVYSDVSVRYTDEFDHSAGVVDAPYTGSPNCICSVGEAISRLEAYREFRSFQWDCRSEATKMRDDAITVHRLCTKLFDTGGVPDWRNGTALMTFDYYSCARSRFHVFPGRDTNQKKHVRPWSEQSRLDWNEEDATKEWKEYVESEEFERVAELTRTMTDLTVDLTVDPAVDLTVTPSDE